ncbi:MAG: two-component response regulator [Pseudarthrobacter sp.]|nr:two-component response regulator [Pseudarthrobacter sp.]
MEERRVCLVIEDDDDIRGLIAVILTRAGFYVRAVATGTDGIAAAADPSIDLVTMDLGLPDMDGHEVARAVRALSSAPMLFLTARAESDDLLAGVASGAAAYLTKPFRAQELREVAGHLCPDPAKAAGPRPRSSIGARAHPGGL